MKKRSWFRVFLFIVPAVIGFIGFAAAGKYSFSEALFQCVQMYVLEYGETPPNLLVDIARWLAPLATASGILLFLSVTKESIWNVFRYLRGGSVAVYGPEAEQEQALRELGSRGICGKKKFVRAERYILLGSEEESIAFYSQNKEKLEGRTVYFRSRMFPSLHSFSANLIPFSQEEIAARLFWKKRCIYPLVRDASNWAQIVILGFGLLGEELLYWGLQDNVFSPDQQIQYHVFGDCGSFLATHTQLSAITDPVHCHSEPWTQSLGVLRSASLIIVVEQEGQTKLLRDLRRVLPDAPVTVFSKSSELALFEQDFWKCDPFNWMEESSAVRNILDDRVCRLAKTIHLRYRHIYAGVGETAENREAEWAKLDAFTRMSNISCADYHEIRMAMLNEMHISPADPDADMTDALAELEHIRWCRYYFLNNWQYGVPAGRETKCASRRIHRDLRPYSELDEQEKEKDRENIRVLLSVSCSEAETGS